MVMVVEGVQDGGCLGEIGIGIGIGIGGRVQEDHIIVYCIV